MSRHKDRLAAVQTVYSARETHASVQLRQCEQALAQAKEQLTLLRSSRDEHSRQPPAGTISAGSFANRAAFFKRLNQAIAAQQQQVVQARHSLSAAQRNLAASRRRTRGIEKVRNKRLLAAQAAGDRREQKELDDLPSGAPDPGDTGGAT